MGILAAFGIIYTIRINVMTVWLSPREVGIEELTFVALVWLPAIMGSYAWLAKDFSVHDRLTKGDDHTEQLLGTIKQCTVTRCVTNFKDFCTSKQLHDETGCDNR